MNLVHILGISSLFGSVLVLDLRLLGVWRHVPLDVAWHDRSFRSCVGRSG